MRQGSEIALRTSCETPHCCILQGGAPAKRYAQGQQAKRACSRHRLPRALQHPEALQTGALICSVHSLSTQHPEILLIAKICNVQALQ